MIDVASESLSRVQIEMLWHTLGMRTANYRRSLSWWIDDDNHRNHFCLPVGLDGPDTWMGGLVRRGLMAAGRAINHGADRYYHATNAGIRVAREAYFKERGY